jgi:hypothetical protein
MVSRMKIELTEQEAEILVELLCASIEQIEYKIKMRKFLEIKPLRALYDLKSTQIVLANKIIEKQK